VNREVIGLPTRHYGEGPVRGYYVSQDPCFLSLDNVAERGGLGLSPVTFGLELLFDLLSHLGRVLSLVLEVQYFL